MKAITLWQPWASLVALGVKTIETRSWSTNYRGPLAIHAAKRRPPTWYHRPGDERGPRNTDGAPWIDELERFCELYPDCKDDWCAHVWTAPLGAVVATCELVDVVPTESVNRSWAGKGWGEFAGSIVAGHDQLPYGDFTPGRFAWLLDNVWPLSPMAATGRQGLWEWDTASLAIAEGITS